MNIAGDAPLWKRTPAWEIRSVGRSGSNGQELNTTENGGLDTTYWNISAAEKLTE
jgi:hypothetical protein